MPPADISVGYIHTFRVLPLQREYLVMLIIYVSLSNLYR